MQKPIQNEKEYEDALTRIYQLMQNDIKQGSSASDELDMLSISVKDYEQKNYSLTEEIKHAIDIERAKIKADPNYLLGWEDVKKKLNIP